MRRAVPAFASAVLRHLSVTALPASAALALLTGLLPWAAAVPVWTRIWPVLLFLAAVTILAELADDAGLFEVAATLAARLGGGRVVVLWLLVVLLATTTTVLLSLDTTAVLLTPVVLALAARLELPPMPFAMTTVWLANTASLLLPVSNLTNLLAVERLGWSAATWAGRLWAPAAVAVVVTVVVLWALHHRDLRGRYVAAPGEAVGDPWLLAASGICCAGLGMAVALGTAPWLAACTASAVLIAAQLTRGAPGPLARGRLSALLPWRLVLTTVSIFVVVAAADRHGLAAVLRDLAGAAGQGDWLGATRSAGVGALGSNAVNNLPAYLAIEPAVTAQADSVPADGGAASVRLLALVVGTNVGPLVTVWASLATLLWRERCRARGVQISARRFAAEGVVVGVPLILLVSATVALMA